MYGRGNYAPPYGQGPQRPMPPYRQQPPGPHFQQGHPFPPPQAGLASLVPPLASAYPHPLPTIPQEGWPVSKSPLPVPGGAPLQHPYAAAQHNYSSGTLNPRPVPPPPPSSVGLPQTPPLPPPYGQSLYGQPVHQRPHSSQQGPPSPSLPPSSSPKPPAPPSSSSPASAKSSLAPISTSVRSPLHSGSPPSSDKVPVPEPAADIATHGHNRDDASISDEDLSRGQSFLGDLSPYPPKPADEKVVRNIEVLCQFIAKNGPGFEEMARQKELGNPDFKFLFGGEPGSEASHAREYYLWMKKRYGLISSTNEGQGHMNLSQRHVNTDPLVQPNALTIIGTTHSPADSDVDMEDDITQSDKEPAIDLVQDRNPKSILTGELLEMQKQDNLLQYSRVSSDPNGAKPAKSQAVAETKPEKSSDPAARIDSPFRLIQNYASDDSSEDDGEPYPEEVKAVTVSPPFKSLDKSQAVQRGFQESLTKVPSRGKFEVDDRIDRAEGSSPSESFQEKYGKGNHSVFEKEDKDNASTAMKVDEFGRLVKQVASDSESDDAYHRRRRGKRDRSRSRSQSPSDRRRRRSPRRSPHRRKDRRSRSRSWSPKRRRSRSRSSYRPGGDFGAEKPRHDKVQTRECFDFLKGRCYRGASCRYLHHESDRSYSSRRYKSKEDRLEGISGSRSSDFHGGNATSKLRQEHEGKGENLVSHLDKHDDADLSSKACDGKSKEESVDDAVQPNVSQQGVEGLANVQRSQHYKEGHAQVQGVSEETISHLGTGGEHPTSSMALTSELAIHHSMADSEVDHRVDDSQKVDSSTRSDSSAIQTYAVSPVGLPVSGARPANVSNDATALSNSLPTPSVASQLPSTSQASSLQVDNTLMAPSGSFLPQCVPVDSVPPYQVPLSNQQSHYPVPPNHSWSIPPPPQPRPPYAGDLSMPGAPLPFQQGNPPLRTDFTIQTSLRTHPVELPGHSQVGRFQPQTYHMHVHFPSQGPVPFSSFAPGNIATPPVPFLDSTVKNMQPFQGSNPLPVEPPKPAFQNQTYPQQIPLPYGPPLTAADSMSSYRGGSLAVPGYPSDPLDRDNPTCFLDIGGSRISAHYNPYASTFDKPLTSRFSSIAFAQEGEAATGSKYDSSSAVGNPPGERQTTGGNDPRAGGQSLPRSGGDQYDPLFDSMEPSSESFKKHARTQGHADDNSDILKLSSRYKVLDVEENNKRKEVGAVAAATSLENDEFGETADAEVGAVENGSPSSSPNENAIVAEGEIEIDQVKSEGKSKKNKDSRSMKLFKIAVANFVKEVLKPQWRQGNMSKEAFKTIVKKTVEKVSGAMKNRRLPKSQAKIDHYIDSQRRKLTQLVEGYVSKYKI